MIFDKIWKLKRLRNNAEKDFRKEINSAKNPQERQSIESNMQFDLETLDDDLRVALTRKLIKTARSRDIPIPSESESWGQHRTNKEGFLKDTAIDGLKQRIKNEKKERRDFWKDILLFISGIAAITQLLCSLLKTLVGHSSLK